MPQLTFSQSVAAGATYLPLAGWQYEYLPFNAYVEIGIGATAAGVVGTVSSGSDVLQEESPVTQPVVAGTVPSPLNVPYLTDYAAAGDRLKISCRNTTGGALTVTGIIKVTPV